MRVSLIGLLAGGNSGVARYAAMLARAIDRVSSEFPALRIGLLTTERGLAQVSPTRIEVAVHRRSPASLTGGGLGRIVTEQVLAGRCKADLLHFFDLTGPVFAPSRPFITTLHDASNAHGFGPPRDRYKHLLQPWAIRRARSIVAVSSFAKDEAVRHLGADPAKIQVVHSGPGLEPAAPSVNGARPDVREPYLLYVGNLAEHKNLSFLVRAFEEAQVRASLMLIGKPRGDLRTLRDSVKRSPVSDRVSILSAASDREVEALYQGALAVVHPSRYEGFGFTPLEAMARGCPVLANDIPAIREISGEGAMLLPLDDIGAWADGIRRVVRDERLRSDLRDRGTATVSRYSWDKAARTVCGLFLSLAGEIGIG